MALILYTARDSFLVELVKYLQNQYKILSEQKFFSTTKFKVHSFTAELQIYYSAIEHFC